MFFLRCSTVLAAVVATASLAGCAAGTKEAEPAATSDMKEPEIMPEATADDPQPIPAPNVTAGGVTGAASAGPAGPATREITQNDCRTLAQKYGSLTRSDEEAKLSPKLTQTQRNTAAGNIERAAQTLADRWEGGCSKDLAGKFASEEALKCSMGAKTVSAFDVCLNGPAN